MSRRWDLNQQLVLIVVTFVSVGSLRSPKEGRGTVGQVSERKLWVMVVHITMTSKLHSSMNKKWQEIGISMMNHVECWRKQTVGVCKALYAERHLKKKAALFDLACHEMYLVPEAHVGPWPQWIYNIRHSNCTLECTREQKKTAFWLSIW